MPIYHVQVSNRFILASDDDGSSEDEGIQNMDPTAMVMKATQDATKKAKQAIKDQNAAKADLKIASQQAAKTEGDSNKTREADGNKNQGARNAGADARGRGRGRGGGRGRGEPRGNNQPRYGRRNQDERDGEGQVQQSGGETGGYVPGGAVARDGDNKGERRDRGPRKPRREGSDRQSGNPRTGVRAYEKKDGAGKGNWGKATDNQDDQGVKEEATTEEKGQDSKATNEDAAENKDGEKAQEAEENQEPVEPETPEFSLEEYYANMNVSSSDAAAKDSRQANEGQEIKGKVAKKKLLMNAGVSVQAKPNPANAQKSNVLPMGALGFQSDYSRGGRGGGRGGRGGGRGGRDGDRDGGRGGGRDFGRDGARDGGRGGRGGGRGAGRGDRGGRDGDNRKGQKFNMDESAFPTLGKN